MYNRYIRNDNGSYSRIPEEDPRSGFGNPPPPPGSGNGPGGFGGPAPGPGGHPPPPNGPFGPPPPPLHGEGISAALRKMLDKFHLDNVDSGDLLLLLLLFFLFKEEADEELLIALGLLLIL